MPRLGDSIEQVLGKSREAEVAPKRAKPMGRTQSQPRLNLSLGRRYRSDLRQGEEHDYESHSLLSTNVCDLIVHPSRIVDTG